MISAWGVDHGDDVSKRDISAGKHLAHAFKIKPANSGGKMTDKLPGGKLRRAKKDAWSDSRKTSRQMGSPAPQKFV